MAMAHRFVTFQEPSLPRLPPRPRATWSPAIFPAADPAAWRGFYATQAAGAPGTTGAGHDGFTNTRGL